MPASLLRVFVTHPEDAAHAPPGSSGQTDSLATRFRFVLQQPLCFAGVAWLVWEIVLMAPLQVGVAALLPRVSAGMCTREQFWQDC